MDREQARDALIFALDVQTLGQALEWADRLSGSLRWLKVGARLFCATGPSVVERLRGLGYRVFLDLKFHDIPAQVRGACRVAGGLGAELMTIHASGGSAMIAAAVEGAAAGAEAAGERPPTILAVTVLTSLDAAALAAAGVERDPRAQVDVLARLAHRSGAGGVVCSPREIAALRRRMPRPFALLSPGIRPPGSAADDQARTATPDRAVRDGADYLVVGRPIRDAADPAAAADAIVEAMAGP